MIIEKRRPFSRGVDTLTFVGDDSAVEKASTMPDAKEIGIGAIAAIVALKSKGIVRLAAGGIAAFVGYHLYQARK